MNAGISSEDKLHPSQCLQEPVGSLPIGRGPILSEPGALAPGDLNASNRHKDEYDSLTDVTDNDCSPSDNDDDAPFQVYKGKRSKRRKREDSGSSNATMASPYGLIVIFVPTDPAIKIKSFNAIKLTAALEANSPDGIINIRPNSRLNLLAVDTRTTDTTSTLLRITVLCGVNVRAYQPRMSGMAVGVIHGVTDDISEQDLLSAVTATSQVVRVRRLGKSQSVALTFASATLPESVTVGYVRFKMYLYVEKPTQCMACGRLGHVAAACASPPSCIRCRKQHDEGECSARAPCCANCGRGHLSTSRRCPRWKEERSVATYRRLNYVDYATAKSAVIGNTDKAAAPETPQHLQRKKLLVSGIQETRQEVCESSPGNQPIPATDDMDTFPTLPSQRSAPAPGKPPQNSTAISSETRRKTRASPSTPAPKDIPAPLSSAPGLGGIICSALRSLRVLLTRLSYPIATMLVQLIDVFYPILQGLLC